MKNISTTAQLTAAIRALESKRNDRLFVDPWAEQMAGKQGLQFLKDYIDSAGENERANNITNFNAIRTRFFDDTINELMRLYSITQAVFLAAGLDMRAFRMEWSGNAKIFEIDHKEIIEYKEAIIRQNGMSNPCRHPVIADIRDNWNHDLLGKGYDPNEGSIWILEGIIYYIEEDLAHKILTNIYHLICKQSYVLCDLVNCETLRHPLTKPFLDYLAQHGAPYIFATDQPADLFAGIGYSADVKEPGDSDVSHGRWAMAAPPDATVAIPRAFFVTAAKK